jgi:hypothetical protein
MEADHTAHNNMANQRLYGLMAEFERPEALLEAAHATRNAGYTRLDAYTPFPVKGLPDAIGFRRNRLPLIVLVGGLVGGSVAYFMQWYPNVVSYPLNVGGRPLHSWPSFVPITFELTVLFATFAALIGMLVLNGLPKLYHPTFNVPAFARASQDRFFLCIKAGDEQFDPDETARFLSEQQAVAVHEVAL